MSEASSSEHELLKAIAGGDSLALQKLFARHNVRVFRFIVRVVRNDALAEEIVNEVFVDVWRHAGRYEGRSAPLTWILAIAHNKARSALRKRTEEAIDEDKMGEIADESDTPEIIAQKGDIGAVLRQCLEKLSREHREIIDLVYYHERSVEEASEILGIPEGTVKTRMFHARKKLSELLKRAGIDRGWP